MHEDFIMPSRGIAIFIHPRKTEAKQSKAYLSKHIFSTSSVYISLCVIGPSANRPPHLRSLLNIYVSITRLKWVS